MKPHGRKRASYSIVRSSITMRVLVRLSGGLLLLAAGAFPQDDTIKVDVNLVNVLCTVRAKNGALVGNLQKNDFQVLEDGKPQEIKYFTRETDLPLTIGMLVDVSGSQERLIN